MEDNELAIVPVNTEGFEYGMIRMVVLEMQKGTWVSDVICREMGNDF